MNKLLIGLLIVAAAAGGFFILRKKDKTKAIGLNKELIIGKWDLKDPDPVIDTTFLHFRYDFQKDGQVFRSGSDSVKADTLHYSWDESNHLVIKTAKEDSAGHVLRVIQLTVDSLQVRGADSVRLLLTKVK